MPYRACFNLRMEGEARYGGEIWDGIKEAQEIEMTKRCGVILFPRCWKPGTQQKHVAIPSHVPPLEPHFLTMKLVWCSLWSTSSMIHARRSQDDQGLQRLWHKVVACAGVDGHFTLEFLSTMHAGGPGPHKQKWPIHEAMYVSSKNDWNCVVYLVQVDHYLTSSTWTFPFWESSSWTQTTWRYKFLHLENMFN